MCAACQQRMIGEKELAEYINREIQDTRENNSFYGPNPYRIAKIDTLQAIASQFKVRLYR